MPNSSGSGPSGKDKHPSKGQEAIKGPSPGIVTYPVGQPIPASGDSTPPAHTGEADGSAIGPMPPPSLPGSSSASKSRSRNSTPCRPKRSAASRAKSHACTSLQTETTSQQRVTTRTACSSAAQIPRTRASVLQKHPSELTDEDYHLMDTDEIRAAMWGTPLKTTKQTSSASKIKASTPIKQSTPSKRSKRSARRKLSKKQSEDESEEDVKYAYSGDDKPNTNARRRFQDEDSDDDDDDLQGCARQPTVRKLSYGTPVRSGATTRSRSASKKSAPTKTEISSTSTALISFTTLEISGSTMPRKSVMQQSAITALDDGSNEISGPIVKHSLCPMPSEFAKASSPSIRPGSQQTPVHVKRPKEVGVRPMRGSLHVDHCPTPSPSRKQRDDTRDADSASSSLSPVEPTTPGLSSTLDNASAPINADDDDDSSMDEHQPPPAPVTTQMKTFGDDPSTFPDPTVYEIREVTPNMSEEEIKRIYSVAEYPHDDLHDLIPGTPPDKDFSNAKPSNQVQANTYQTYLEPFFRPLTEEDEAFLRERGDRTTPFTIPRLGKKHYTEIWLEEDGALAPDIPRQDKNKLPANQARGNVEDLNDEAAETDQISAGPLLSRLLATMRPEHRAPPSETTVPATDGLTSVDDMNLEMMGADPSTILPSANEPAAPLPPATYMPESATDAWKKANPPKLDYAQVDERIKQELRHIGFMPPDEEPDYEGHYDDEISARLRMLQADLREVSIKNGARKARLMDLTLDAMAYQEYRTIQDDLDGQLNAAYMKSTRTMGKNKKNKRPGGAGGGSHGVAGVARPGVRDQTKSLMERRAHWIDIIGPAFRDDPDIGKVPRASEPGTSIFKEAEMSAYLAREREIWEEEAEGE